MESKENKGKALVRSAYAENQKGAENHIKTAEHLQAAARHHLAAAKYHEGGDDKNAAFSTIKAQGYVSLAREVQKENVKRHALNS